MDDAALLRLVFDGAEDALIVHDADGRLLKVNRAAAELLGHAPADLEGRRANEIEVVGASGVRAMLERARSTGHAEGEMMQRTRSGGLLPVSVRVRVLDASAGIFLATILPRGRA